MLAVLMFATRVKKAMVSGEKDPLTASGAADVLLRGSIWSRTIQWPSSRSVLRVPDLPPHIHGRCAFQGVAQRAY